MAKPALANRVPLNRSRLAALKNLTIAITEAVVQGNLDLAAELLGQRQIALNHLDWSVATNDQLQMELQTLWTLEEKLLDFCRTWRDTLKERLETLKTSHYLRRRYSMTTSEAQFVDMHE